MRLKIRILLLCLLFATSWAVGQTYAIADSLFTLGEAAEKQEDWHKAAELYEKSAIAEKASTNPSKGDLYSALSSASYCWHQVGNMEKAFNLRQESYELFKKEFPAELEQIGSSASWLGRYYEQQGKYDKALPLYLEWLDITEKKLGKGHADYGFCLNKLAVLYKIMGQYDNALPFYLEALGNTEKYLGKDHPQYSFRLNNLAELYRIIGLYDKALPLYLEALKNSEKTLGKAHAEYGILLNNLALLYESMGQYDKALPLHLESLENAERSLGKAHSEYGIRLNNLAAWYQTMGQYDKALPLSIEALESTEKSLGKAHSEYGVRLNNLAIIYQYMGQYDKALPMLLEALENTEKSLGKAHLFYGIRLNNLANMYRNMGQYDKALPLYLEALENTEKSLGKAHEEYGIRLNNLAELYRIKGQYDKALPMLLEALENTEKSLGKDHPFYGIRLNNLAYTYRSMGQYNNALPLYQEAFGNLKDQIRQGFGFMSENEKEQFLKTMLYNFEVYQSFLNQYPIKDGRVGLFALDIELTRKSLLLQSNIAMRKAVQQSGDTMLLRKFEDWSFTKAIIAKHYSLPLSQRRTDLKELESKAEEMEAALTRQSSTLGALQVGQTQWQQVRDALPEKAVAIEFVSFLYRNNNGWTDSTLYLALVLRRGDTMPHMIPLFEQRQLDSLLNKQSTTEQGFVSGLYRGIKVKTQQDVYNGQKLYELVWKPIDALLQPGDDIYLSPSGTLHQLAFAAIPYDFTTTLSDRYRLHTVGTTAVMLKENENKRPESIAIYGGVSYDEAADSTGIKSDAVSRSLPGDLQRSGETWSYLEGTLREAESIAGTASKKGIQAKLYKDKVATEESLKAQTGINAPDILHIATHGFFFPDPQMAKKEQDGFLSGQQEPVFKASDNPLNRSGILLAGAGKTWAGAAPAEGREDGILTAYEASYLQLANTKLVVLSACETGLGTVKGSEGVYGLQRAFKQAGAEYLLISLWKVPDAETAEFMTIFYGHYFGGTSIEEAFYLTQKAMREKYRNDPYKWAAFVLIR